MRDIVPLAYRLADSYNAREMRRFIAVFGLLFAAIVLGCSEEDDSAGLESSVPSGVPSGAQAVRATETRSAGNSAGAGERLFFASNCVDGLLSVTTTLEVVYAELPCDRALPEDVKGRFMGKAIALRIVPGQPAKLYIDSKEAGSVEFTVGRIWVEEL